jgi:hypothetical protein
MSEADDIARFIAEKGVTRCADGVASEETDPYQHMKSGKARLKYNGSWANGRARTRANLRAKVRFLDRKS